MSSKGGIIHQMDVKSAFLNGKCDTGEFIYLNPPERHQLGIETWASIEDAQGNVRIQTLAKDLE